MGVKILVEFNEPQKIYFPGQSITCMAHLQVPSKQKLRCIFGIFSGTVETQWTKLERRGWERNARYHKYKGMETVFSVVNVLLGPKIVLNPGSYSYGPVSIELSPLIPPSFFDKHGTVRYEFKVQLSTSTPRIHIEPFFVRSALNLNAFPHLKPSRQAIQTTKIGCCGFLEKPVQISLILPRTGFVPGESIPIHIECLNASTTIVTKFTVSLVNQVACTSTYPKFDTKFDTVVLATIKFKARIRLNQQRTMQGELVLSDDMRFRILYGCQLIKSSYLLVVTASLSGCNDDIKLSMPITIGNVAFVQSTESAPPAPPTPDSPPPYDQVILSHLPFDIPPSEEGAVPYVPVGSAPPFEDSPSAPGEDSDD